MFWVYLCEWMAQTRGFIYYTHTKVHVTLNKKIINKTLFLKKYLPEKWFTWNYLDEKCKYTTVFLKNFFFIIKSNKDAFDY